MPLCQNCKKRKCPCELKVFVDETVSPVKLRKFCKFCYLTYRKKTLAVDTSVEDNDDIL